MGAVAVASLVPRPRVVDLDVSRDLQARRQQLVLLLVEGVLLLGQDAAELAGGDVDAQLEQLLQEQRLGDVLVVILVEDETDQVGPEVAAGDDVGGQRGDQGMAVGGLPTFAAVAGDPGAEDQVLNDEVLVPFEGRLGRHIGQRDDDLVGDDQFRGLGPFDGPGSFLAGFGGTGWRSFEATGSDTGRVFRPLRRAISSSSCWRRSCWVRMISSNCRTNGVASASGMSGRESGMARFYQLEANSNGVIKEKGTFSKPPLLGGYSWTIPVGPCAIVGVIP